MRNRRSLDPYYLSRATCWVGVHRFVRDRTATESSMLIPLLMTALLTFRTPALAPLWLVGAAAAIPLSLVIGPMVGASPREPPTQFWSTAVALIPAAVGTALGFGARALTMGRNSRPAKPRPRRDVEAYDDVRTARSHSVSGLGADQDDAAPVVARSSARSRCARARCATTGGTARCGRRRRASRRSSCARATRSSTSSSTWSTTARSCVRARRRSRRRSSCCDGLSVAEFYAALRAALGALGIDVPILAKPYGFPGQSTPFAEDREHHAYDAAAVRR